MPWSMISSDSCLSTVGSNCAAPTGTCLADLTESRTLCSFGSHCLPLLCQSPPFHSILCLRPQRLTPSTATIAQTTSSSSPGRCVFCGGGDQAICLVHSSPSSVRISSNLPTSFLQIGIYWTIYHSLPFTSCSAVFSTSTTSPFGFSMLSSATFSAFLHLLHPQPRRLLCRLQHHHHSLDALLRPFRTHSLAHTMPVCASQYCVSSRRLAGECVLELAA
ncbi:hypothetical protein R3P38DRAFT_2984091 [Favolaschia claudopus]|uniref:Uncharacterized protein n=1 Tax=Favolaschia claudopus TaxID=2862362 RepID=A0AAW0AX49_9AGAR